MNALALHLALTLTEAGLQILGTSTCPTPAEVQTKLVNRPGPNARTDQPALVRLDQDSADGALRLRVYDENGVLLGVRALPPERDCRLLADAAATLLRSLELELEGLPGSPQLVVFKAPEERQRPIAAALELGAGGIGSFDGSAAGGALLLAALVFRGSSIGPELAMQFETSRQLAVEPSGSVSWWRIWAAPGLQWRVIDRRRFWLSLHVDVPLGALVASGTGFAADERGAAFDLGISLGMRVGLRFPLTRSAPGAVLLPWLGLWGAGWPLSHALSVAGESSGATLPRLEGIAGLGLSWSER